MKFNGSGSGYISGIAFGSGATSTIGDAPSPCNTSVDRSGVVTHKELVLPALLVVRGRRIKDRVSLDVCVSPPGAMELEGATSLAALQRSRSYGECLRA